MKNSAFLSNKSALGLGPDVNYSTDTNKKGRFWDILNETLRNVGGTVDAVGTVIHGDNNYGNNNAGQNGDGYTLPTAYSGSQSNQVTPLKMLAWAGAGTVVLFGAISLAGRNKDKD